jgi:hypothetical protein
MRKRLQITLPEGWSDYSKENPDGPPTYLRDKSEVPGPLQVSFAHYQSGVIPNPTYDDLVGIATGTGKLIEGSEVVKTSSGDCDFGRFGSAIFRSPETPRMQSWHLSNGRDFIMVTHICPEEPDPEEVEEVQEIVKHLTLKEIPWWIFW